MRLVCFKFVDLALFHLLAVVMAFYGQRAVNYRNIFSRPLAVASTGVYTARLYINPVDFYGCLLYTSDAADEL